MGGAPAASLEVIIQQPDHKAGERLTFSQGQEPGLLVKVIGHLDGKTLHGMDL